MTRFLPVSSFSAEVISKLEIEKQLFVAARQYAIIETAVRSAAGHTIDEHARDDLIERFQARRP